MNTHHLSIVSGRPDASLETVAERIRKLQAEASSLAREHILSLERLLEEVAHVSYEISEGGDAYPIGARELCRQLSEIATWKVQTLEAIMQKT